ncbi:MAG: glycosyltransferase family 4 protein, partial [Ignavibacteria bacterium]|nr:glycosyltransferase family 4 protein [Ignavibacteria bacterium]
NYMMYRNLILQYKLEDRVFLKGYTNNISETMKSFDVFVLSSRYEGIPYVVLEAMRNSIPLVTTDAGGISEIIENMRNGIIVEKGNPAELARSVNLLLNDSNLSKKLTLNSKNDFESGFRIEESIKRIESVFNLK